MKPLILFLFLLSAVVAPAQHRLNGRVTDEKNAPLPVANVLLLNQDSVFIKAALSDNNGQFEFSDLAPGIYRLRTVLLGYFPETLRLQLLADSTLAPLRLRENSATLQAVDITAEKPFLEQKAGMLVVNVANSIMGADGSTMDVLKRVPGMIIVQDQIRLNGRTGVNILIDGRPTQYVDLTALLNDMPAANIERIEVISQPGAKYDAQGTAGIINIILKKNVRLGLNGNVSAGAGYGQLPKYRFSGNIGQRNERINVFGSVSFNHRSGFEGLDLVRRVGQDQYLQNNYSPDYPYSLSVRGGVNYYIGEKQTYGIQLSTLGSRNRSTDENDTRILYNGATEIPQLRTTNAEKRQSGYASADAFYQMKFDTAGHVLDVDFSYSAYDRQKENLVQTGEGFPDRRQILPGGSAIAAGKLDYARPLNKHLTLESGLKASHARVDNNFVSEYRLPGSSDWLNEAGQTNHFIFEERISAAYGTLKFQWKKIEGVAGLRFEDAHQKGTSITLDSVIRRRFTNLFPNLSVQVPIVGKIGVSGAYSYRIDRPGYGNLNPFVYYLDPFTYRRGNPYLRPELTHSMKFSLTWDKQPALNFEYDRSRDVIQLISQQNDSTGVAYGYSENFQRYEHIGGSVFFPLNFVKKLSGYGGCMLYFDRYRSGLLNDQLDQSAWNFTAFMQATYKFSTTFSAEMTGWYRGPGVEGLMLTRDMYGVDAAVQYKFWNKQATLRLNCNNLFFQYFKGKMQFSNLNVDITSRWETRIVNLSFSYSFGNQFLKKGERRKGSADDERRRNNE